MEVTEAELSTKNAGPMNNVHEIDLNGVYSRIQSENSLAVRMSEGEAVRYMLVKNIPTFLDDLRNLHHTDKSTRIGRHEGIYYFGSRVPTDESGLVEFTDWKISLQEFKEITSQSKCSNCGLDFIRFEDIFVFQRKMYHLSCIDEIIELLQTYWNENISNFLEEGFS